jgi:hypothetical protein
MATYSSQFEVEYVECPLDRAYALRSAFDMLTSILDNLVAESVGEDHCFCVASSAPIADSRTGAQQTTALPVSAS